MDKPFRLLMTETSHELCRLCKQMMPAHNIEVLTCPRHGTTAYFALLEQKPDAVLLDVFMPGMDAFSVKRKYNEQLPNGTTHFYVTGTFQHEDLEKEIIENGFMFYFLKPFDVSDLITRILAAVGRQSAEASAGGISEEDMVTDMLRAIGVPAHIKGYHYLRDAILRVVEDPDLLNYVTKRLYPLTARYNDTTPSRVERAIRHAIEVAWDRGDIDTLNHYFGGTVHSHRGKPTNSEFIAMLADRVIMSRRRKA